MTDPGAVSQGIQVDWTGVSAVIGAAAAGLVALGTFAMQLISYFDQRKLKLAQDALKLAAEARDVKLDHLTNVATQTAAAVNGINDKRAEVERALGEAQGHARGVADERADPQVPAGNGGAR